METIKKISFSDVLFVIFYVAFIAACILLVCESYHPDLSAWVGRTFRIIGFAGLVYMNFIVGGIVMDYKWEGEDDE